MAYSLLQAFPPQLEDANGNPLAGGSLEFYVWNTTTPATLYTDSSGTALGTSCTLNTLGRPRTSGGTACQLFGDTAQTSGYKIVVKDADGVVIPPTIGPVFPALTPATSAAELLSLIDSGDMLNIVNVKDYGARGDGATDDSVAFDSARIAVQSSGGILYIPPGTYAITDPLSVTFTAGNIRVMGAGMGASVLKAADSADMPSFVAYTGTGSFHIDGVTVDGNRSGGGTAVDGYALYFSGKRCKATHCEVKQSRFAGIWAGALSGDPGQYELYGNWIHDNGGLSASGNGVGLFGGGTDRANDFKIIGNRFENNYNTVTGPNDSTAINLIANSVFISQNYFVNNYNVNGGQVAVSDPTTGAENIYLVMTGNIFEQTGTFGSDMTCGIEINGCRFTLSDNIIRGATGDGIRIEGDSAGGVIHDNIIDIGTTTNSTGVNLITSGGTGGSRIKVHHNEIISAYQAFSLQSSIEYVELTDNYIDSSVTSKVAGADNFAVIRGNYGYDPADQDLTPVGSPWTSSAQNFDCMVIIKTVNGLSALTIDGNALPITARSNFFLKAGKQFVATWTGTAPVFTFVSQQ